jgi:DNA-binding transcriptional ArsR family regulator
MPGKQVPPTREIKTAPAFAALGDPVRLAIFARLCGDGPLPTVKLKKGIKLSRQGLTKHLWILADAGLVRSDRVGRDRSWRIETDQLAKARSYLDQISAQWDERLERLRTLVENEVD